MIGSRWKEVILLFNFIFICFGDKQYSKFVFKNQKGNLILHQNQNISLNCSLNLQNGNEFYEVFGNVTWFKDEKELKSSSHHLILQNKSLIIVNQSELSNSYHCNFILMNSIKLSSKRFIVKKAIIKSPNILGKSNIEIGSFIHLICNFSNSFPKPKVSWFHSNKSLDDNFNVKIFEDGNLLILNLKLTNSGKYFCEISNEAGKKRSEEIEIKIATGSIPKMDVLNPWNKSSFPGSTIFFHCLSKTPYDVVWTQNSKILNFSTNHFKQFQNGTLKITNITSRDHGIFTCSLRHQNMQISRTNATLEVISPPFFTSTPNPIYNYSKSSNQVIPCSAEGLPQPEVTWLKDGRVIPNHQLTSRDPIGFYQCLVTNKFGNMQILTQIVKPFTSTFNTSLHVNEIANDYVILNWEKPENDHVRFVVAWSGDRKSEARFVSKPEVTISGLTSQHSYNFRLFVCDVTFVACYLQSDLHLLFDDSIEMKITNVTSSSAHIEIDSLMTSQINGSFYNLIVKSDKEEFEIEPIRNKYELKHLKSQTEYFLKIQIKFPNGKIFIRSQSQFVFKTLEETTKILEAPKNLHISSNKTSSIITWSPLNTNQSFDGYKIVIKTRFSKKKRIFEVPSTSTSFVFGSLRNHVIKVCAFNSEGLGRFSSLVTSSTSTTLSLLRDESQEEAPEIIEMISTSSTIQLKWRLSEKSSEQGSGYILKWGELSPDARQKRLRRHKNSFTIRDLLPDTTYYISIRCIDSKSRENIQIIKTQKKKIALTQTDLYPPLGVAIEVLSPNSINVSWGDTNARAPGSFYSIRCRTSASVDNKLQFFNTTSQNIQIDHLTPFTYYQVSVRVTEADDMISDWSMIASARTSEMRPTSAPCDVTIMTLDNDVTSVTWQPPEQANGNLNGYLIFYSVNLKLDISDWMIEVVIGADDLSCKIEGLTPNTHYYFIVQARNSKGTGPMSDVVHFQTPKSSNQLEDENQNGNYNIYLVIGILAVLFILVVVVATVVVCCNNKFPSLSLSKSSEVERKRRIKYSQPNHVTTSTEIYRTPDRNRYLSNGVPSNSWSRTTLYRSKTGCYDDRRLDSYITQPTTDETRPTARNKEGYYAPFASHFPCEASLSDFAGDSAYGSDHPLTSSHRDEACSSRFHGNYRNVSRGLVDKMNAELAEVVEFVEDMKSNHSTKDRDLDV